MPWCVGPPCSAVWLLTAGAISLVADKPIQEGAFGWLAFGLLWGLAFLWFLATWLYGRQAGGQVLLDCGPHPTRTLFLFMAFIFLFTGITGLSASKTLGRAAPIFGISFGLYWFIIATGRLQVRETGIWQYWSLLPWAKIGSYRWANDSTLLLRTKGALSFLFRGALPVPSEHQDAVDQLLQKYCAVRPAAPAAPARSRPEKILIWLAILCLTVFLLVPCLAGVSLLVPMLARQKAVTKEAPPLAVPEGSAIDVAPEATAEKPMADGKGLDEWKRLSVGDLGTETRVKAMQAFAEFGGAGRTEEALVAIKAALQQPQKKEVIRAGYQALVRLGPPTLPLLLDGLQSQQADVRRIVARESRLYSPSNDPSQRIVPEEVVSALIRATRIPTLPSVVKPAMRWDSSGKEAQARGMPIRSSLR